MTYAASALILALLQSDGSAFHASAPLASGFAVKSTAVATEVPGMAGVSFDSNVVPPSSFLESSSDWPVANNGDATIAPSSYSTESPSPPLDRRPEAQSRRPDGPASIIKRNDDRPPAHRGVVVTGGERRASWDSYASPTSRRSGAHFGGVVGAPGGTGDWRYASGRGPAIANGVVASPSIGTSSAVASSSSSSTRAAKAPANGRREALTGRDRRAAFDDFSPFAPAHEPAVAPPPSLPAAVDPVVPSAERESPRVEEEVEPPIDDDDDGDALTAEEVPMDTPARRSLPPHLSLRAVPGKGLGVVTNVPIANNELVGYYEGELMSEEVKDRRYLSSLSDTLTPEDRDWIQSRLDRGQTLTGCYLYGVSLPDDDIYTRFQRGDDVGSSPTKPNRIYVDAEDEHHSLWTRFLNHASPPLANVNPKSVHESWDGKPRVWFMANRDIEEGEEICFDYGDDYWLEGDDVY